MVGDPEQVALFEDCKKSATSNATEGKTALDVAEPLVTSAGDVTFDTVAFAFIDSGPGGCVTHVDLTLARASTPMGCTLEVEGGPEIDERGSLRVTLASLNGRDCPGPLFEGRIAELDAAAGTVSFDGLSCDDSNPVFEEYYFAGAFEIRLTGEIVSLDMRGNSMTAVLTGAPLRVTGRMCDLLQADTCPGQ
jgi:hypothetical protein